MGQTKSKAHFSTLSTNSWRRLSDSDCIHLLSHPEYFENDTLVGSKVRAFDDSQLGPRPSSASTFFESGAEGLDTPPIVMRSMSLASADGDSSGNNPRPVYRKSVHHGSHHHHHHHHQHLRTGPAVKARLRPISMFAFEDHADQKPTVTSETDPATGTDSTPPSLKQIENMNLSLNDFLEQANATDMVCRAPPPVRLRGRGRGPRRNGGRKIVTPRKTSDDSANGSSASVQTLVSTDMEQPTAGNNNNNNNNNKDSEQETTSDKHRSRPGANAVRCSGLDCMCDRCLQSRFKLLNWLLPNCTRMNSERLLSGKPDGTFLVRKSEKFPGQYTLSFVCRRAVRHCLIMRSVYGKWTMVPDSTGTIIGPILPIGFGLRWPYSFETLQQVILHYTRHSLTEFNSKLNIHLKYPVFTA